MRTKQVAFAAVALVAAAHAGAQPQPSVPILAQAVDRCMATQAVRLTRTGATDADIYAQAVQSCRALSDQLRAAIGAEFPPAEAGEIIAAIDARAEPDFMAMLSRIRSDRTRRGECQQGDGRQ